MAVVYRQEELDKLLECGDREITLCSGIFCVRRAAGVVFRRIGPVKVKVDCTARQAEELGLKFVGFMPEFEAEECKIFQRTNMTDSVDDTVGGGSVAGGGMNLEIGTGTTLKVFGYGINLI